MRIRHLFLFILAMSLIAPTEAQVSGSSIASEEMVYDAHGNITGITRRGKVSSGGWGVTDNLTLSYDGNRLAGVSETLADYDLRARSSTGGQKAHSTSTTPTAPWSPTRAGASHTSPTMPTATRAGYTSPTAARRDIHIVPQVRNSLWSTMSPLRTSRCHSARSRTR